MKFYESVLELTLKRSVYSKNGATYLGLFLKDGEPYVDVTVNTPYSAKNTIVLNNDFISLCSAELVNDVLKEIADGKICDIEAGWLTLPKYWLKYDRLIDIEELEI